MSGKVSVIIPVYNAEQHLDECIRSVAQQTHKNLEIILVDDGSTDGSGAVCREYAEKDVRIVFLQKENGGPGSARNMALDNATGDYIAFVDSDDRIEPEMYETMIAAAVVSDADAVMCNIPEEFQNSRDIYSDLVADRIGSQLWRFMFASRLWAGIRMPDARCMEDTAVLHKLLYGARIATVNKELYNYYFDNPDSISNHPSKMYKNAVDRAVVLAQRYEWMQDKTFEKWVKSAVLSKSVGFLIGSMGLYKANDHSAQDVEYLKSFAISNYCDIIKSKSLSLGRKIAVSIICISPSLYYNIRNIKQG